MDIVTIDFETYYDREYSLSKMTTEAYVRDDRFEVIGVGIKVNDQPTDWYSGSDPGRFLKSLDYRNKAILCHNTAFDGAILSWRFGIRPKFWFDTLSMARPLHNVTVGGSLEKLAASYKLGVKGTEVVNAMGLRRAHFPPAQLARYGEYCCNDVELTYKLFKRMKQGFPISELMLIDQTIRMYTEPTVQIDKTKLIEHLGVIQTRKKLLLSAIGGDDAKGGLMSNQKFAALLESLGAPVPMKTSKTTGKQTYAFSKTDQDFLRLLDHPNEQIAAAVAARLGVKSTLEETRTQALMGVADRGSLPIMLNYYGAHTGRFSGGDKMNLQNLPRGGTLRKSLRAPDGMVFVASDSSQIEARVIAWLAQQTDLLDQFRNRRDVYSEFATDVYGRRITKQDAAERHVGKTAILGLGYGMGAPKFRDTLALGAGGLKVDLSEDEAKRIVGLYRDKNHRITTFWRRCNNALDYILTQQTYAISDALPSLVTMEEGILLPNGFVIRYPLLNRGADGFSYCNDQRTYREALRCRVMGEPLPYDKFTRIYAGKVAENITQALARIVVSEQMTKVGSRYKVALQVHDEIVIVCDEEEAENAKMYMEAAMSTPPTWAPDLPVACEAHIGKTYGDVK
jgi:DNA polymerase